MEFVLSQHAKEEAIRRGISPELIREVLEQPQQVVDDPSGCRVYQSLSNFGSGKLYLLRVFVNEAMNPAVVVTVYRTSKVAKYWSAK